MYILTQDNGIVNVSYYRSIEVSEVNGLYKIVATLPMTYETRSEGDSTIATFRNENDAYHIIDHIFEALVGNPDTCVARTDRYDARTAILLEVLWGNIKERLSNLSPDEVLDALLLSSSDSRRLTITIDYPSKSSEFYSEANPMFLSEREKVIDELNNTVVVKTPIQIKWKSYNLDSDIITTDSDIITTDSDIITTDSDTITTDSDIPF